MHESNGHTAFSYAAGNALDRVEANVTNTEEAQKICFQQKWSTICPQVIASRTQAVCGLEI